MDLTAYDTLLANKIKEINSNDDTQIRQLLSANGLGDLPYSQHSKGLLVKKLARKLIGPVLSDGTMTPEKVQKVLSGKTWEEPGTAGNVERSGAAQKDTATNSRGTYYAVCIPGLVNTISLETNMKAALSVMKDHKSINPRMVSFSSYEDAKKFVKTNNAVDVCKGVNLKTAYPNEKAEVEAGEVKLFPSLTAPQVSKFRLLLERGQLGQARECLAANPRYLVGNGENPTILKEGPRYNAMHASVAANQLESCKLVMSTVSDINYLRRMYNSLERAKEISYRLIDLYLNTPDKVAKKTPLHIASEKGLVDIVTFLVSFKACIRDYNKRFSIQEGDKENEANHGQTPEQIACARYRSHDVTQVRKKIISLINEGTYYVPLIKTDQRPYAKIADPFQPISPFKIVDEVEEDYRLKHPPDCRRLTTPLTPDRGLRDLGNARVRAYAGPMSPKDARDFKRVWQSPQIRRTRISNKAIDEEKGLEHTGRELAETGKVNWQEYWSFLDSFADLTSKSGLEQLELFLLKHRVLMQVHSLLQGGQFKPSPSFSVSCDYIIQKENLSPIVNDSDSDSFHSAEGGENSGEDEDFTDVSVTEPDPHERSFSYLFTKLKSYFSPSVKQHSVNKNNSHERTSEIGNLVANLCSPKPKDKDSDSQKDQLLEKNDHPTVESSLIKLDFPVSPILHSASETKKSKADGSINQTSFSEQEEEKEVSFSDYREVDSSSGHISSEKDDSQDNKELSFLGYREGDSSAGSFGDSDSNFSVSSPIGGPCPNDSLLLLTLDSDSDASSASFIESKETSFNTNLNILSSQLEKFTINSPGTPEKNRNCDNLSGQSHIVKREPCCHLFAGKTFSALIKHLEKNGHYSRENTAKNIIDVGCLPVLILRPLEGEDLILGDLYLPLKQARRKHPLRESELEDETHRTEIKNVWVGLLVAFPTRDTADRIAGLEEIEIVTIQIVGTPEDKDFYSFSRDVEDKESFKTEFLNCKENFESMEKINLTVKVVRSSTRPTVELFICGLVATNVDGDVFRTINSSVLPIDSSEFPLVREWLQRMNRPNQPDFITSLPSPMRVRRQSKMESLPPSPLVMPQRLLATTPVSSKPPTILSQDSFARKLFSSD